MRRAEDGRRPVERERLQEAGDPGLGLRAGEALGERRGLWRHGERGGELAPDRHQALQRPHPRPGRRGHPCDEHALAAARHALEVRRRPLREDRRPVLGVPGAGRVVHRVDRLPLIRHDLARGLEHGAVGERLLRACAVVHLAGRGVAEVVPLRRVVAEVGDRVRPSRDRLRLERLEERERPRPHLGRHDPAEVLLEVDDVDDDHAAAGGPELELAADRLGAHADRVGVEGHQPDRRALRRRAALALGDHDRRDGAAAPGVREAGLAQALRQGLLALAVGRERRHPPQAGGVGLHANVEAGGREAREELLGVGVLLEGADLHRRLPGHQCGPNRPAQHGRRLPGDHARVPSPRLRQRRLGRNLQQDAYARRPGIGALGNRPGERRSGRRLRGGRRRRNRSRGRCRCRLRRRRDHDWGGRAARDQERQADRADRGRAGAPGHPQDRVPPRAAPRLALRAR